MWLEGPDEQREPDKSASTHDIGIMFTSSIYVLSLAAILCHGFSTHHNDTEALNSSTEYTKNAPDTEEPEPPRAEALLGVGEDQADLPVFPQRPDAVYFVVAAVGGARTWGRILGRTLLDMGPPLSSPQGPVLRPIYVDLPQNGR